MPDLIARVTDSQGNFAEKIVTIQVMQSSGFDEKLAGTINSTVIIPAGEVWGIDGDVVFNNCHLRDQGRLYHDAPLHGPGSLTWLGIDETQFVGGGMEFLESDKGLWVEGGLLDIHGTPKTAWTRLAGSANGGATSIELCETPVGWLVGDELIIVPSEHPSVGSRSFEGFESRAIVSVSGTTVTLDEALDHAHPISTNPFTGEVFTAEVLNMSRDMRISGEGHGIGRSHVTIMSSQVQKINYINLRYMGPRSADGDDPVVGRYPLHWHHNGEGSRGTLSVGVVVQQSGNHGAVPHASHGITLRDYVLHNIIEEGLWWDPPPWQTHDTVNDSHDILYDHCIAGLVRSQPWSAGSRLAAFWLGPGLRNEIRDCVGVGVWGGPSTSIHTGAFVWPEATTDNPEGNSGVWIFSGKNIAHNNRHHGIFTWQNHDDFHLVSGSKLYNNPRRGTEHGAYVNRYNYIDNDDWDNGVGVLLHAQAKEGPVRDDGYSMAFERYRSVSTLIFTTHNNDGALPVLFKDCVYSGVSVNDFRDGHQFPTHADLVGCTKPDGSSIEPSDFSMGNVEPGLALRVQRPDGTAYQMHEDGSSTTISPFYPAGG